MEQSGVARMCERMAREPGCPERYAKALSLAARTIRNREAQISRVDGILCDVLRDPPQVVPEAIQRLRETG
jgi:hypothetical protein